MALNLYRIRNAVVKAQKVDSVYVVTMPDESRHFINELALEALFKLEQEFPHGVISHGHAKE